MKMMMRNQKAVLRRHGAANPTRTSSATRFLLAAYPLAVWAVVMHGLTSVYAAEVFAAKAPDNQPTQAQKPAGGSQGRQMERYQAFVRQAELPPITVTNTTILEVGGAAKLDLARLAQLTGEQQEALAGQFGVPVGVIEKVVQGAANGSPPGAGEFVQELRGAVIDYRFLLLEWERYNPPAEGQKAKSDALAALQAGDISKAWKLYDGLRKPQAPAMGAPAPPGNLRIVPGP